MERQRSKPGRGRHPARSPRPGPAPASPGGGVRLAGTPRGTACKRWDMGPPAPPRAVSGRRSTAPRGEPVARGPHGPQTTRGPHRAFLSLTPLSGRCFVRVRLNYLPPPRAGRRTRVGRPGPRSHRAPDTARSKPLTERGAAGAGPAGASEQCLLSELARGREDGLGSSTRASASRGRAVEETGEDRFTCAEISQMTEGDGVKTGTKQRQVRTPSRNERHWEISLATTRRQVPTPNPARPRPLIFQDKPREGAMTLDLRGEAARGQQRRTETPARRRRVL